MRLHILPVFGDYKLDKLTTPIIQQQVNKWADKANKGEKGAYANYSFLNNIKPPYSPVWSYNASDPA